MAERHRASEQLTVRPSDDRRRSLRGRRPEDATPKELKFADASIAIPTAQLIAQQLNHIYVGRGPHRRFKIPWS